MDTTQDLIVLEPQVSDATSSNAATTTPVITVSSAETSMTNNGFSAVHSEFMQTLDKTKGDDEQVQGAVGGNPVPTSRHPEVNAWVCDPDSSEYRWDPFLTVRMVDGRMLSSRSDRPRPVSAKIKEYWAAQKLARLKDLLPDISLTLQAGRRFLNPESGRRAKSSKSTLKDLLEDVRILEREINILVPNLIAPLIPQLQECDRDIQEYIEQADLYITSSMSSTSWNEPEHPPDRRSQKSEATSTAMEMQQMDAVRQALEQQFEQQARSRLVEIDRQQRETEVEVAKQQEEIARRRWLSEKELEKRRKIAESEYNSKKEQALAVAYEFWEKNTKENKPISETLHKVAEIGRQHARELDNQYRASQDTKPKCLLDLPVPTTSAPLTRPPNKLQPGTIQPSQPLLKVHFQHPQPEGLDYQNLGHPTYSSTPVVKTEALPATTTTIYSTPMMNAYRQSSTLEPVQSRLGKNTPLNLTALNAYVGSIHSSDLPNSSYQSGLRQEQRTTSKSVQVETGPQPLASMPEILVDVLKRQSLPSQTIPKFSGDPLQYSSWMSAFKLLIHSQNIEASQKLLYLQQYLTGEALRSIEGCLLLHTESSYTEALQILEHRFGDQLIVAQAFRGKMDQWPAVKQGDGQALRNFSDFVNQCKIAAKEMPGMSIFEDAHYIRSMVEKLPQLLIHRWSEKAQDILDKHKRQPTLAEFAEFARHKADVITNPVFGNIKSAFKKTNASTFLLSGHSPSSLGEESRKAGELSQEDQNGGKQEQNQQSTEDSKKGVQKNRRRPSRCACCDKRFDHYTNHCPDLGKMDEVARNQLFEDNNLCKTCGYKKHDSTRNCEPRCRLCKGSHFTFEHKKKVREQQAESSTTFYASSAQKTSSLARIMPVRVTSKQDPTKQIITLAFLDEGSDRSFAVEELVEQLNTNKHPTMLKSSTLFHESNIAAFAISGLRVSPINSEDWLDLPTVLTVNQINIRQDTIPTEESVRDIPAIESFAEHFPSRTDIASLSVGLLIARDIPEALKPLEVSKVSRPYAVKSALGWGVVGSSSTDTHFSNRQTPDSCSYLVEMSPAEFIAQMERDFDETPGDKTSQQDQRFMSILQNGIHINQEGHYEMPLPFKMDVPNVTVNTHVAKRRLTALKRKFDKDPEYQKMYCTFMNTLIDNRDCEEVPEDELENYPRYYLPHHGVINSKKPGKVRVVFDCSAQTNGVCLNDFLLQGPDQLNSLTGVLCRFRKHQVAFACDVERMFHMFHVIPEHRDYLRFFWWKNGDTDSNPIEYRMRVHIFGATSSPGCATYGLRQIANDHAADDPEAAKFLQEDFYVDDGIASREDSSQACTVLRGAVDMCKKGNLRLHKIASNDTDLLSQFPSSELSGESVTKLTSDACTAKERTLGLVWDINTDRLLYHISKEVGEFTRRGMLSTVASVYDPLGFVAPFVLSGRLLLQEMCKDGLAWDDQIPKQLEKNWRCWIAQFEQLRAMSIPRCFLPRDFGNVMETQIHHFSDASNAGYGQCSYLRFTNENGFSHCTLVCAKSRVVPIKRPTVPRLELQAAVLSVKASKFIKTHLQLQPSLEFFWTDSQIVIAYLKNTSRRFHTFVAHRVNEILSHSDIEQWHHIDTATNPADHASRGLSVEGLETSNWFSGPEFLSRENFAIPSTEKDFVIQDDDAECYLSNSTSTEEAFGENFTQRFSSMQKACKILGILESCAAAKHGTQLTILEARKRAEETLIKATQRTFLSEKSSKTALKDLSTVFDDQNILRVTGRLTRSSDCHLRQPVFLPRRAHLTKLIVRRAHEDAAHGGRTMTSNEVIRQGFHVVGLRQVCKEVVGECTVCRKIRTVPLSQKMADLPEVRLEATPPFENVGVDCFGPYIVQQGRKEVKRYGLMCTCLSSRAVHIEVLDDMTTSAFILALRNIISLRGNVKRIYCDRGTNFVGASREFKRAFDELDPTEVERLLAERTCEFHFSPARASHMGGVWERQIRTAKGVLSGLLHKGKEKLTPSSLRTLFYEAAAIINGRPYSAAAVESRDVCEPLTPNHLLTLKSAPILPPPGDFSEGTEFTKKQWRTVQRYVAQFWSRWKAEYLSSLRKRQKWHRTHRNLAAGDVVILHDEEQSRNRWKIGLVESVHVSNDGRVRSAELRQAPPCNKRGVPMRQLPNITRPIHKLTLLVAADE